MNSFRIRSFSLGLAFVLLAQAYCQAQYHPDHPKVINMIDKGIAYLEGAPPSGTYRSGGICLAGYTILKVTGNADHPKVLAAIEEAKEVIRMAQAGRKETHIVYDMSVACMLLAAANPEANRYQLEEARDWFLRVQKPNGGFGYLEKPNTGDTSQVQYVMLALWSLSKIGLTSPAPNLEACLKYLKATQDPSGSWGYQGIPSQGNLVPQDNPTKSLGTAGICALLLACDQLKFFGSRIKDDEGIPKAFERVDVLARNNNDVKPTMKRDEVEDAIKLAFRYQEKSPPQGQNWYYYWRYGQERYESLREIVDGKQQKSPSWYNHGVEEFSKTQGANGSWSAPASTPDVDTALAILFLLRSTQRAIGKLDEGVAFGGDALPMDVTSIRMVGEKIVSDKDVSVENLLALMEDKENQVSEGMLPNNLVLSKNPQERALQAARLTRLLDSDNALARRLAARLLGRSEDLNAVPDLIYALTDNDSEVPKLAEEGLRLLSRHLSTVHLKQNPTDEQRAVAVKYWKEWYLGLRPDFVFIDRK